MRKHRTSLLVAATVAILALSLYVVRSLEFPAKRGSQSSSTFLPPPAAASTSAASSRVDSQLSPPESQATAQAESHAESLSQLLTQLLLDYQSHELDLDEKRSVQAFLRDISDSQEGRALITRLFFSSDDTRVASAMYDLILDADLKDPALIVTLVERDHTEFHIDYKMRLVDLIADLNTSQHSPYNVDIEDFLAAMSVHPDKSLRSAALGQWAWYVSRHKGILPVLDSYLFNHARQTREEIYEIIELDALTDAAEEREVANALGALVYADYLKIDDEELKRVQSLISQLQ
ncbi:hypothetical protein [Allohahella marinimesophila]